MPGPLCRLSIQHGPDSVDLALPRDALIGALLPSIVDLVHRGPVAAVEGRQWYLSRVGQEQLDEATSLTTTLFAMASCCCSRPPPPQRRNGREAMHGTR